MATATTYMVYNPMPYTIKINFIIGTLHRNRPMAVPMNQIARADIRIARYFMHECVCSKDIIEKSKCKFGAFCSASQI